jgi:rubrerythrin
VLVQRVSLVRPISRKPAVAPQAFFGGGGNKSSSSAFYICIDCGYIYDNMAGPWNEIPSYFRCPACNSPKSR